MSDVPSPNENPNPSMPATPSLGRRLGARLVDAAVLFIPVAVLGSAIGDGFQVGDGNTGGRQFVATLVGLLVTFAYFVAMESERGGTLGKSALGLRVEQADAPGARLTPTQAAKRNAFELLSIVPTALGGLLSLAAAVGIAVTVGRDPEGRGFHDRWAGARVVARP
jgi:uncharacterized RDD family membrane protein YckC